MIGGKKWTCAEFTTLVKGNFWSTNEKDWNRKALLSLKQGSTLMDTFITRFNTFQALMTNEYKSTVRKEVTEMKYWLNMIVTMILDDKEELAKEKDNWCHKWHKGLVSTCIS